MTAASSVPTDRADARLSRMKGRDDAWDLLLYSRTRMKLTLVRLVAIIVLSLHVMPLGLPLFCDTDRHCDGQMPMPTSFGPSIDQKSNATTCATSLFCATMGTVAIVLGTPPSVFVSDSYVVGFDVSTFARFDPQPPPAPPPQA